MEDRAILNTSKNKFKRALIIAAHPDDEVLGCGGTIARLSDEGTQCHAIILTGTTTSRGSPKHRDIGESETENAAAALKLATWTHLGFPDNRLDTVPFLDIIRAVEEKTSAIFPDIIFTHDFSDLNQDHRIAHQIALTVFRPLPDSTVKQILAFETLSSSEWQDPQLGNFAPNFYVDITNYIDRKITGMDCYKSELRKPPHPRSLEIIRVLATKRGAECGVESAEAFRLIRGLI